MAEKIEMPFAKKASVMKIVTMKGSMSMKTCYSYCGYIAVLEKSLSQSNSLNHIQLWLTSDIQKMKLGPSLFGISNMTKMQMIVMQRTLTPSNESIMFQYWLKCSFNE